MRTTPHTPVRGQRYRRRGIERVVGRDEGRLVGRSTLEGREGAIDALEAPAPNVEGVADGPPAPLPGPDGN
jgi:hypothetical protein